MAICGHQDVVAFVSKMALTAKPVTVKVEVVGLTVDYGTENGANVSESGSANVFVIVQDFEPVHAVASLDHVPYDYACPGFVGLGAACRSIVAQLVVEVVAHPVLSLYFYKEVHEEMSTPVVYVIVEFVLIIG